MNIMRYMVITVREKYDGTETAEYHGTYLTRAQARKKVNRIAENNNAVAYMYGCSPYANKTHPRFDGVFNPASGKPGGGKYTYDHFIIKPVI